MIDRTEIVNLDGLDMDTLISYILLDEDFHPRCLEDLQIRMRDVFDEVRINLALWKANPLGSLIALKFDLEKVGREWQERHSL